MCFSWTKCVSKFLFSISWATNWIPSRFLTGKNIPLKYLDSLHSGSHMKESGMFVEKIRIKTGVPIAWENSRRIATNECRNSKKWRITTQIWPRQELLLFGRAAREIDLGSYTSSPVFPGESPAVKLLKGDQFGGCKCSSTVWLYSIFL